METAQRAVLFVDVTDSTKIYESLGDTVALALINGVFSRLEKIVAKYNGLVVKSLGDGIICVFEDPDNAFRAACEIQTTVHSAAQGTTNRLQLKIGFTYGSVILSKGDVFGDTMNVCARLVVLANPEQILTSAQTVEALSPGLRSRCRALFPTRIKGKADEVAVSEVMWRYDPAVTETNMDRETIVRATRGAATVMKLSHRGDTLQIGRNRPVAHLGRDETCDIVVSSLLVSRVHARIQYRDGNYVLSDLSTNGTYMLADERSSEVELHHEDVVLGDRGYIGLGRSAANHGDHTVRFRIEPDKP